VSQETGGHIVTSQIHIQGTATDPSLQAQHALRDRGDALLAEFAAKVALTTDLQFPLGRREELRDRLVAFCTSPLVRYRLAIDQVLYSCAAGAAETRLLVRALRVQHDLIAARIAELKRADSSEEFAASAHALVGLLEVCHQVEQEVLLPALALLPGVDLSALADDVDALLAGGVLNAPGVFDVREMPGLGKVVGVKSAGRIRVAMPTAQPCLDEVDANPGEATVVSKSQRHGRPPTADDDR